MFETVFLVSNTINSKKLLKNKKIKIKIKKKSYSGEWSLVSQGCYILIISLISGKTIIYSTPVKERLPALQDEFGSSGHMEKTDCPTAAVAIPVSMHVVHVAFSA